MKINFLGGALEIGGSSVLVRIDNKNILFDAGIRQGANRDPVPNYRMVQESGGLDGIIISHAHLDHIGSLPIISKEYPNARIYMNHMTKDLVRVQLYDSLKIMNNREAEIPMYAEQDVVSTLNRIFPIGYEVKFPVFQDMNLTLYNAGHIAGSSFCFLSGKEGSIFYSGDFSVFSQRSIEGAKLPKLRPDVAIIETTYGDRLHSSRDIEEKALIDMINEAILSSGKVLIPAFALGRAQEIILILKAAMNKGTLKKVKVYVDGMVRDVNRMYERNPLYLKKSLGNKILKGIEPFYDDNIIEVKPMANREELLKDKDPVVFIASSGMLTGGPSAFYAEKIAALENGYIAITGYQDEESPGRQIMELLQQTEGERYLKLNGVSVLVKGKMCKIGLSAHSDKSEIKGVIERLGAKHVILNHGNEEVVQCLGQEIAADYRGRIYTPACGEELQIAIRYPKKQMEKRIAYIMNSKEILDADTLAKFYQYILLHYEHMLFTIEELYYIWYGVKSYEEEQLKEFQTTIVSGIYFESDRKRLFLWKAREHKDVEDDLITKELTPQQLTQVIENLFVDYNYKKISFMNEKKMVRLIFDFPDGVDSQINQVFEEFVAQTRWQIEKNDNINNNAVDILIKSYFQYGNVLKISFLIATRKVKVTLSKVPDDIQNIREDFARQTGWEMMMSSDATELGDNARVDHNYVNPQNKTNSLEQNEALYLTDLTFAELEHKPYKKSIKRNGSHSYLELVFITPKIGRRYIEEIQALSNQIGWDITISDKVNQNELITMAQILCVKYGVELKKNPSFIPRNMSIQVNALSGEDNFGKMQEEFKDRTGCEIEMIKN